MADKGCAQPILEALKFLKEEDLRDYVQDVLQKARANNRRGIAAIRSAQAEIEKAAFDDMVKDYFENAQATIQNFKLYERNTDLIKNGMTVRDVLVRQLTKNRNLSNNVESAQRAEKNYLMNVFLKDLSDEDIAYLTNPDNQLDIARAMMGENASVQAKRLGNAFMRYRDERSFQMVESHALPLRYVNKNRFIKMTHDPSKMTAGTLDKVKATIKRDPINYAAIKNQWIDYIYKRLDLDETFNRTKADKGELGIDEGIAREILSKTYDRILEGADDVLGSAVKFKDLNMLQRKSQMFFQWKSPESWVEYNRQYGTGDLYSALLADVHGSGSRVGMARIMGAKPTTMYKKLMDFQQKEDPKGKFWKRNTSLMFNEITGETNRVDSPTLARIMSNIRQWTSMGSLFTLPIQSLTDANMAANWLHRFNINYVKASLENLDTVVRTQFTDAEKKRIGKQFYAHLQSHGGYMGRFAEAQNMGQLTSKLSTQYYTRNGTMAWDRGNKIGVIAQSSKALAQVSHLPFDRLTPELKKTFGQFNITRDEWEALRTKNEAQYFTLDNVDKLTDDDLKAINKGLPDRALYEIRNEVYRKVFSMFDVGAEQAILRPGAYEKAFMYQGTRPGTITGEAMRTLMQFKGFPFSYITRQLMSGFNNADGFQAKLYWGLQNFVYTLPLSFLSTWAYNLGQGKTMPDPTQMNWSDSVDFYMGILAAPLGSLNNVWSGGNENYKDTIMSLFSNPSIRLLGSTASLPIAAIHGQGSKVEKNARDAFLSVFPFTNAPFASPYIRQALGQKPYLDPGQQMYGWAPQPGG